MVLSSTSAKNFTDIAIANSRAQALQREVDLTERSIQSAINRQRYDLVYDARIIGNPAADPSDDSALTEAQIDYRDAFVNAGYLVTLDADTGYWRFSWDGTGDIGLVSLYVTRTTLTPGAIAEDTIDLINTYIENQIPAARVRTEVVELSGGDIPEGDFGASNSSFYEYVSVVQQQDPADDFSTGIRAVLTGSALGYNDSPPNVFVYKLF